MIKKLFTKLDILFGKLTAIIFGSILIIMLTSISFASFETKDIYNLIYNYYVNSSGYTDSYAKELVNANKDSIEIHLSSYVDSDDYNLFVETENNALNFFITNNNSANRYRSSSFYVTSVIRFVYYINNNTISWFSGNSNENRGAISSPYWTNQTFTSGYGTDIYWSGIHNSPSWFLTSGPYDEPDAVWEFTPLNNEPYVVGDSPNNFYRINKGVNNVICGYLEDSVYTLDIAVRYEYYDKENHNWEIAYTRIPFNIDSDVAISEIYQTTTTSDDTLRSTLTVPNNLLTENMIVHFIISGKTSEEPLETIEEFFYVFGPNTVYSGDKINISSTFNDNYYDDYLDNVDDIVNDPSNQIINSVDNINNTITDNSQVSNIVNNYLSGDAQAYATIFNYHSYDNPFADFVYTVFNGCSNALLGSGDVIISINHHGTQNFALNSREFRTPDGPIKTLVSSALVFWFIYLMCMWFYYIIHALQTFDYSKVKNNLIDQSVNDINFL